MKELLFVCSAGKNRSLTGAAVFTRLLGRDGLTEYRASSTGWENVTEQQAEGAYGIFAADGMAYTALRKRFDGIEIKMRNLQIPDVYDVSKEADRLELEGIFEDYYAGMEWKEPVRRQAACGARILMGP